MTGQEVSEVMAGLVPAISIPNRDRRDKPGDDQPRAGTTRNADDSDVM
jgi:hypothetical protein